MRATFISYEAFVSAIARSLLDLEAKLILRPGESQAQFIAKVIVREVERRERKRKPK
jgi:hypothetical protein